MTLGSWRIVKRKHTSDAFSGEGARLFGGRWNSPGIPVVYTAENASLAVLEILAHFDIGPLLPHYVMVQIKFKENLVAIIEEDELPREWRAHIESKELMIIGDRWAGEAHSAVLSVPNTIVPVERNYLLNPQHPDFSEIEIGEPIPFSLDARLART